MELTTRCVDVCKDERVSSPERSSAARGQPSRWPGTPSVLIWGAAGSPPELSSELRARPHGLAPTQQLVPSRSASSYGNVSSKSLVLFWP